MVYKTMLLPLPSSSSMDRRRHQCQKIILRITPVRPRASISTTPPKIIPDHSVEVGSERMSQERKSARARGREGEAERKGGREGETPSSVQRPAVRELKTVIVSPVPIISTLL